MTNSEIISTNKFRLMTSVVLALAYAPLYLLIKFHIFVSEIRHSGTNSADEEPPVFGLLQKVKVASG